MEPACSLSEVATLVLDESDRLLDMGFEEDLTSIQKLLTQPRRWTMLFSATFSADVRRLATTVVSLRTVYISVGSDELTAAASVTQTFEILKGKGAPRFRRLCELLLRYGVPEATPDDAVAAAAAAVAISGADGSSGDDDGDGGGLGNGARETDADAGDGDGPDPPKVLVFVLFKKEARDIAKSLNHKRFSAKAFSGDMSQSAREQALQSFRDGRVHVLVATDVAARGLDVSGITHVVNFSLGMSVDTYVHRVGRCGRAGRTGVAHTFVVDGDDHL